MGNSDGLDIQFVQQQWEESQKLIGDLRVRLASLVNSSEVAGKSAASLQAAEKSIADLASSSESALQSLKDALEQSLGTLRSLQEIAAQSDFGAIAERLDEISSNQGRIVELEKKVDDQTKAVSKINEQTAKVSEELAKMYESNTKLVKAVEALSKRLESSDESRKQLTQKVRAAVNTLPSRHQAKFAQLFD